MSRLEIRSNKWLAGFLTITLILAGTIIAMVIYLDPYFHYHAPLPEYVYPMNNERSQDYGIIEHFEYDGMITGTSMAQNFKTSMAEELFGGHFIKPTTSGGTYKELNNLIELAFNENPDTRIIIRTLDHEFFFFGKDEMREDMGTYPTYLYNNNPFDDVNYIFNRDVVFGSCIPMLNSRWQGAPGYVTPFDEAWNWMGLGFVFGRESVLSLYSGFPDPVEIRPFTEEERQALSESIDQNILSVALEHPDADFYCFFPPYSVVWWGMKNSAGELSRQMEAERLVIEKILEVPNIHLYSWNDDTGLVTDLSNYKDNIHYGEWINDEILVWMKEGKGLLTKENYEDYLEREWDFYSTFDYNSIFYEE